MIKEKNLEAAFLQFRQDPFDRFKVKLRRKRAEQLRNLLSDPDNVDIQTFNREVWVLQRSVLLRGEDTSQKIDLHGAADHFDLERIAELDQALETGSLEFHGNTIWGSGSRVYAPGLRDEKQKLEYIRTALSILNKHGLTPIEKAKQLKEIYGFGNNIATGLVMVFHPDQFNIYNNQGKQIISNLGYELDGTLENYEQIAHELKERLNAEDFLELDWFLYSFNKGRHHPAEVDEVDTEPVKGYSAEVAQEQSIIINQPYPFSRFAEATGFAEAELRPWVRAIERKGQAILYGPPGTGKTFMAEQLARHLVGGGDGFYELVQFHPAYAYEDFIQGIRPESDGERLSYPLKPGRFLEFCRKAQNRRNSCVLIIDEINRANLARVFGELMYLLEYREREIPLSGSGALKIPTNVQLIGTMNTADRSIALVDHALRRRFAFIKLEPKYAVLRRFHQTTGFPVERLVNILQRLNQTIQDEHYFVGITFFLHENLGEEIEDIWRMEIEPYLEEYFFDQPGQIGAFRWDNLKRELVTA